MVNDDNDLTLQQRQRLRRQAEMERRAREREGSMPDEEEVELERPARPEGGISEEEKQRMAEEAPEQTEEKEAAADIKGDVVEQTEGQVRTDEVEVTQRDLLAQEEQLQRETFAAEEGVDASEVEVSDDAKTYDAEISDQATERIEAEQRAQQEAQIEQQLEEEYGTEFEQGRDYTLEETDDGLRAEFTGRGEDRIRGRADEDFGDLNVELLGTDRNLEEGLSAASRKYRDITSYVTEGSEIRIDPGRTEISRSGIDYETASVSIEKTDDTPTAVGGALDKLGYEGAADTYESGVSSAATGAAAVTNVPEVAMGVKEIGEYGGYAISETAQGRSGVSISAGEGGAMTPPEVEIEDEGVVPDTREAAGEAARGAVEFAKQNPGQTAGLVGGSLVASAGVISGASRVSTRGGRAAAYAIQPGEEALTSAANVVAPARVQNAFPGGRIDNEEIVIREAGRAARGLGRRVDRVSQRVGEGIGGRIERIRTGTRGIETETPQDVEIAVQVGEASEIAVEPETDPSLEPQLEAVAPEAEIPTQETGFAERVGGAVPDSVQRLLREERGQAQMVPQRQAYRQETEPELDTDLGPDLDAIAPQVELETGRTAPRAEFEVGRTEVAPEVGYEDSFGVFESETQAFEPMTEVRSEQGVEPAFEQELGVEQQFEREFEQEVETELESEAETEVEAEPWDLGGPEQEEAFGLLDDAAAPILTEFGNPLGETGRGEDTTPDAEYDPFEEMFGG